MNLTKKQLSTINNLRLFAMLDKMDDRRLEEYCITLDKFVTDFPTAQEGLKKAFEARDSIEFSKNLVTIVDMLTKIYASDLAQSSFILLGNFREGKYESAEALLNNFLTTISTLSIDIQMAQFKNTGELDANEGVNEADASVKEQAEEKQKSILAVDDISLLLNALKALLQNTPYKFTGVTSGSAAIKYVTNHVPDLFILDIEMPGMNGYELAKRIRGLGQKAPIIFLTGNATSEYVRMAIQAGAADFIVKPVSKDLVLEKINKYIR